jgi:tetratricopeptide (TPR) repeat protein
MAIEGPLRELGIHDVFQLLDLSRKTGRLRVTSSLRDNEGTVYFREGRVVGATIRSNPHPIGQLLLHAGKITEEELERATAMQRQAGEHRRLTEILVSIGALTVREVERQVRRQIEAVVFELLSWQEGSFSFADGELGASAADVSPGLSTESLLMEAARRIDEWARIADLIPNLGLIPVLADVDGDHQPMLDLRPSEWEVLAAVDGTTDVRAIAAKVSMSEFEVAKIVYGLVSTAIVVLREPARPQLPTEGGGDALMLLSNARQELRDNRPLEAVSAAEQALRIIPDLVEARLVAAHAYAMMEQLDEAAAHLQQAQRAEPHNLAVAMAEARLTVRRGDLTHAIECWQRVIRAAPRSPEADQARRAMAHASQLSALVEVGE